MPGSGQSQRVSLTVWGAAWVDILALPLLGVYPRASYLTSVAQFPHLEG